LNAWASPPDGNLLFTIKPYTVLSDQRVLILKFQLNKNAHLLIALDGTKVSDEIFPANQVQELQLGKPLCGKKLTVDIERPDGVNKAQDRIEILAPACEKDLVFGFLGDSQRSYKKHKRVAELAEEVGQETPFSFVLNLGDVVEHGAQAYQWEQFFLSAEPYSKSTPMVAAIGNHEFYNVLDLVSKNEKKPTPSYFKKYFRWKGAPELGYYSIPYESFELLIFNSNFNVFNERELEEQWEWVEEVLKRNYAENRSVIFCMHFPPFSSYGFHDSKEGKLLRRRLVPLLEKYKVKLVLSGHTHIYERSRVNGVNYVVSGPSGGPFHKTSRENPFVEKLLPGKLTFGTVRVNSHELSVKIYDEKNVILDELSIQ
jgi:predicted phosphodiesterase